MEIKNSSINLGSLVIPILIPQKGVDYFTTVEVNQIKQEIYEKVEKNVNIAEQLREEGEGQRKSNETYRIMSEEARITQETQRVSAEEERIRNETFRNGNEEARISQEELRVNQEILRNTAEQTRNTAENAREQSENMRTQSEATRVLNESKRNTVEQSREENETIRETEEEQRVTNENERIANEKKRVEAEIEREGTIQDIKNSINKLNEKLAGVEEKTVNTRNELERVKNDVLDTGNATDTYIHLEDSAMAEYQELSIDGVCEQYTTTGKNLFPSTLFTSQTVNGVTFTINKDGSITAIGTSTSDYTGITLNKYIVLQAGTYKISCVNGTNNIYAQFYDKTNKKYIISKHESSSIITLDNDIEISMFSITIPKSGTNVNVTLYPQLERGSTATEYEPYTGGESSPNPSYRQPISVIENSLKITSNNGELEDSENYLFSQITANIPDGEFIGKINDTYKDTLKVEYNEDDGEYHLKLYKNIGKVVLDGTEPTYEITQLSDNIYRYVIKQLDYKMKLSKNYWSGNTRGISNYFKYIESWNEAKEHIYVANNIAYIYISNINTIDDFKAWLSTHNTETYYPLATPYVVDLGIVDMPIAYNEVTNLFTDSTLMPTINAKYYRNFISTIQNLQVNEKALKQELVDINARLSALESAQTNLVNEREVVE